MVGKKRYIETNVERRRDGDRKRGEGERVEKRVSE